MLNLLSYFNINQTFLEEPQSPFIQVELIKLCTCQVRFRQFHLTQITQNTVRNLQTLFIETQHWTWSRNKNLSFASIYLNNISCWVEYDTCMFEHLFHTVSVNEQVRYQTWQDWTVRYFAEVVEQSTQDDVSLVDAFWVEYKVGNVGFVECTALVDFTGCLFSRQGQHWTSQVK